MLPISFGRVHSPTDPHRRHLLAYLGLGGGMWGSSHKRKTSTRTRDRTWPVGELVEGELIQMDRIRLEECGLPVIVIDRTDVQRGFERDEAKERRFRCRVDAINKRD